MFGFKKLYINVELIDAVDKKKKTIICQGTEEPIGKEPGQERKMRIRY